MDVHVDVMHLCLTADFVWNQKELVRTQWGKMNLLKIHELEEMAERQPEWGIPQLGSRQDKSFFLFPGLTLGWKGKWQPVGFALSGWQSAESRGGFFQAEMKSSRTRGNMQKLEMKVPAINRTTCLCTFWWYFCPLVPMLCSLKI